MLGWTSKILVHAGFQGIARNLLVGPKSHDPHKHPHRYAHAWFCHAVAIQTSEILIAMSTDSLTSEDSPDLPLDLSCFKIKR